MVKKYYRKSVRRSLLCFPVYPDSCSVNSSVERVISVRYGPPIDVGRHLRTLFDDHIRLLFGVGTDDFRDFFCFLRSFFDVKASWQRRHGKPVRVETDFSPERVPFGSGLVVGTLKGNYPRPRNVTRYALGPAV